MSTAPKPPTTPPPPRTGPRYTLPRGRSGMKRDYRNLLVRLNTRPTPERVAPEDTDTPQ